MTRVIHAGWCDGGPLAGKQLAHDETRYRVAVLGSREINTVDLRERVALSKDFSPAERDLLLDLLNTETRLRKSAATVDGWYVWDEGAWRWQGYSDGSR
jgi:hypothetical protein